MDSVSGGAASDEKAVSYRIPRKYPPAPEGTHRALCVSAEVKEVQEDTEYAKKGDKRIHFGWELTDPTYKDDDGNDRKFRVWSRPMTMMFKKGKGKTPNIVALMMKLTGYPPFVTKKRITIQLNSGPKEVDAEEFDQKMVESMECNLTISHEEWQGEMRAGIDSYSTTEEMRKKNFMCLTPEARTEYKGQVQETQVEAKSDVAKVAEEAVKPMLATETEESSAVSKARETLKGFVSKDEFEAYATIVLDSMDAATKELLKEDIAAARSRCGL